MTKERFAIYFLAAALFSAAGFFLGMRLDKDAEPAKECQDEKTVYQAGFDSAAQRLADAKIYNPGSVRFGTANMRGIIREISDDKIIVAIFPLGAIEDMIPYVRTVLLSDSTKFYRQVFKDKVDYQKEVVEYQTKVLENLMASSTGSITLAHPSSYDSLEASRADMKAGAAIGIVAENDEGSDITASEIFIGTGMGQDAENTSSTKRINSSGTELRND